MNTLTNNENQFITNYLCNTITDDDLSLQKTNDPFYLGVRALIVGKLGVAHSAFRKAAKQNCPASKKILDEISQYFRHAHNAKL